MNKIWLFPGLPWIIWWIINFNHYGLWERTEENRSWSQCVIFLRILCFWKSCFSFSESIDFEQWSLYFHFYWRNDRFSFKNQRKTIKTYWNIHFLKEWVLIQWYYYVFNGFRIHFISFGFYFNKIVFNP